MNEDSGSSQVMRPFPPSKQRAEIELQQGAPETSIFIWHSNKPLSDCCMLQYSFTVALKPNIPTLLVPFTDSARLWPVIITSLWETSWVKTGFASRRRNTQNSAAHRRHFTHIAFSSTGEAIFQSWEPYFILGHPDADKAPTGDCCVGVAHWGGWPRSCRSAKRAMPRGLEKAEEPQPPVPIRLRADNCTRPWGSHPNKLRRERKGRHRTGSRSFFSHWENENEWHQTSQAALWIVDTESYTGGRFVKSWRDQKFVWGLYNVKRHAG